MAFNLLPKYKVNEAFSIKFTAMTNQVLLHKAIQLVKEVGVFLKEEQFRISAKDVDHKSLNSLVTYVDKRAEAMLVKGLSDLLPDSGFIAEEDTSDKKGELYNWIIDPLDGTTNFIHQLPMYSISVALMKNTELDMGFVYLPHLDEFYHAINGEGAFLNYKSIFVSDKEAIQDGLIATGFPYYDFKLLEEYNNTLSYFIRNTRGVRRMGSAAIDLVYVAAGKFEAFYEYNLNPWDVAAGALIVAEAGGKITQFDGGSDFIFGRSIIATNSKVHAHLQEVINENLPV